MHTCRVLAPAGWVGASKEPAGGEVCASPPVSANSRRALACFELAPTDTHLVLIHDGELYITRDMRLFSIATLALLLIAGISGAPEEEAPVLSVVRQSVEPHLRQRSAALFDAYRSHLAAAPQPLRTVVFTCDVDHSCGGLGDRFKGLVSAAVLAILLDADFRAYWEHPVRCLDCI